MISSCPPNRSPASAGTARWLCCWLAVACSGVAQAQHLQPELSLQDAVDRAKTETHGQILTASTVGHGRTFTHRIKVLLPDGHIRTLSLTTPASKNGSTPHTMPP